MASPILSLYHADATGMLNSRVLGHRRPHNKTRKGCYRCKARKVKCDEVKPQCIRCARSSTACSYPALTKPTSTNSGGSRSPLTAQTPNLRVKSSPASTIIINPSPPGLINTDLSSQQYMEDLELMHFYTEQTSSSFSSTRERQHIWQTVVPRIAFSQKSLLNGLLSLAALQLSELQPHRRKALKATSIRYHDIALLDFVAQTGDINSQNCAACFVFSAIFVCHAWASSAGNNTLFFLESPTAIKNDTPVELTQLIRGIFPMLCPSLKTIEPDDIKILLEMWLPGVERGKSMLPEDRARLISISHIWNSNPLEYEIDELETLNEALSQLEETLDSTTIPNEGLCTVMATLAWPADLSESFFTMVGNKRPAALIVLAHYCILLGKIEARCWWLRGISRNLLDRIFKNLDAEWECWISWPMQDLILREFRRQSGTSDLHTPYITQG